MDATTRGPPALIGELGPFVEALIVAEFLRVDHNA